MNFLVMPIVFLSGAFFPLKDVPTAIAVVTRVNPLTYGIDGFREALTSVASLGMFLDFVVLATVTSILLGVGSYLFSRIRL